MKNIKKAFVVLFIITMSFGMTMTVSAKTKKLKPKAVSNKSYWSTDKDYINKHCTSIKTGTYKITPPKASSSVTVLPLNDEPAKAVKAYMDKTFFLKFKAPKTKNYTFSMSKLSFDKKTAFQDNESYMLPELKGVATCTLSLHKYKKDKMTVLRNGEVITSKDVAKSELVRSKKFNVKLNKGDTIYLMVMTYGAKNFTLSLK